MYPEPLPLLVQRDPECTTVYPTEDGKKGTKHASLSTCVKIPSFPACTEINAAW